MAEDRPTPFSLIFGELATARFPALRDAMAQASQDPRDRDGFLLVREVNELLQSLRPEEGLGEGVGALAALVHAAYLFWLDGQRVVRVDEPLLARLLADRPTTDSREPAAPRSGYVQLPPLRVWGVPVPGAQAEPLDGWFASRRGPALRVLAVFGLHPGREGMTVAGASGPAPRELRREDGSPLFGPTLEGGAAAGLASIQGEEELLELAWRAEEIS